MSNPERRNSIFTSNRKYKTKNCLQVANLDVIEPFQFYKMRTILKIVTTTKLGDMTSWGKLENLIQMSTYLKTGNNQGWEQNQQHLTKKDTISGWVQSSWN